MGSGIIYNCKTNNMKTFDSCSDCSGKHTWKEIDYYNVLYVSKDNAVCLTLCPLCVTKFKETNSKRNSVIQYKQKIDNILLGKAKSIPYSTKQNYAVSTWGLFF
jgi:hypothetical protein